jgi:hypothetical protein
MDFSDALRMAREGHRITREGWNGRGMYVVMQKAYPEGIPINQNTADATGLEVGTVRKFLPYLMFHTAQGDFVPWVASQTDLLAEDWLWMTWPYATEADAEKNEVRGIAKA